VIWGGEEGRGCGMGRKGVHGAGEDGVWFLWTVVCSMETDGIASELLRCE
jgi:hypothetical protein